MLKRLALLALLLATSSAVLAQYDHQRKERSPLGSRGGQFEASVILALQSSVDKVFDGGSSIDVDSKLGWGFSVGWNWSENLNLSYRFAMTEPDYLATIVLEDDPLDRRELEHTMSKYSNQFNVTYNFSGRAFSPFVTAGLGWTKLDSNVPTGGVDGGCWWDPWWGYICFADWETYSANKFSYNLGLGFRWDMNTVLFTRGAYSMEFVDIDSGTLNFGTLFLEMGMMF